MFQCSYYHCPVENYSDALEELDEIIANYAEKGLTFPCFQDKTNKVLIKRTEKSAVIHSIIWPTLVFIIGLILSFLGYREKIGIPMKQDEEEDEETILGDLDENIIDIDKEKGLANNAETNPDDDYEEYTSRASRLDRHVVWADAPNNSRTDYCPSSYMNTRVAQITPTSCDKAAHLPN